jgi:hypothetical protein
VNDLDGEMQVVFVLCQFGSYEIPLSDKQDFHSQGLDGSNRTFHFRLWRVISAQGVESDSQHKLLLSDFDDFTAFILATIRAHAVRELLLVAVGALRQAHFLQGVMSAAFAGARGGVSTFGIRHFSFLG